MIINHFRLKKGKVSLEANHLDFSEKGIYLLSGDNGSGKTTFIETILKDKRYLNITSKHERIAYFSQRNYKYPMSVSNYLTCSNRELLNEYISYFSIDCLNEDIMNLSGGEFVVVSLIRCFIKDTPIIILDEPTNNLDNGTAEKVNQIINELSATKTIILSTHDERLKFNDHVNYHFSNGKILKEEGSWSK